MLYATPSRSESDSGDRDYTASFGLGAITPSRTPSAVTSGGGYRPAGSGGGGGAGAGETLVTGARPGTFRPSDRNVTIMAFAQQGKNRLAFSKSGRGAKYAVGQLSISPITYGLSGLEDLAATVPIHRPYVATSGGGIGPAGTGGGGTPGEAQYYVAGSRGSSWRPADTSATIGAYRLTGRARQAFRKSGRGSKAYNVGGNIDALGLGDLAFGFSNLKPKLPSVVSKAIRYTGAATATVLTGGFLPASTVKKTFGLSSGEAKKAELGLKAARVVTVATFGAVAAGAAGYGPASTYFYGSPVATGPSYLSPSLSLSTMPSTASTFGGGVPIATSATFGAPIAGTDSLIAASSAAKAVPASSFLSTLGKGVGASLTEVAKTAVGVVGTQAILASVAPRGSGSSSIEVAAPGGSQALLPIPVGVQAAQGQADSFGSAGSSDFGTMIAENPWKSMAGVGLAVAALVILYRGKNS